MAPIASAQIVPPDLSTAISTRLPTALTALGVYILVFLAITYVSRRDYDSSLGDYVVASRGLGWVVASLTLVATVLSGVGMAGFPGTVYSVGIPFIALIIIGYAVTAPAIWYFGRRMWVLGEAYGFNTPGDLLGEYYGSDTVRLYTVIASVAFNTTYVVAQLLAGGIVLTVLTGGLIPFDLSMVIVACVVTLHVSGTGMKGIAYLDTFNGALITVLIGAFAFFIMMSAGGVPEIFTSLGTDQAAYTTVPGVAGVFSPEVIILFGIFVTLGNSLLAPAAWVRMYALDSEKSFARVAGTIITVFTLIYVFGTIIIGLYGRSTLPSTVNPDTVSSLLAFEVMPFTLAALFLVGILAAVISTTDSYTHVMAATISRDFIRAIIVPDLDETTELKVNKAVMALTMLVGLGGALFYPGLITPLALIVGGVAVQLLSPLIGAVAWPRASTEAAIIAPAIGTVLLAVFQLQLIPNPFPTPMVPGLVTASIANLLLFVGISYLTKPQPLSTIEQYHGLIHDRL